MNETSNYELDLFQFFKTFWDGKWIISAFILLTLLLGTGYYLLKKPVYESKITVIIDNIPPFYKILGEPDTNKLFIDFQKTFYSANIFRDWKKINPNTLIKFEDFSKTKTVNGTIVQKKNPSKITFELENKKNNFIFLIVSNDLKFLDDVYNYVVYINNFLNSSYKLESINALSIIEKDLSVLSKLEKSAVDYMPIKIFLLKEENGEQPFIINHPTMPMKVSPKLYLVLIISVLLGGIFGYLYVITRNVNHNRKN